jgi:Protein of unknown function (DUF4231)
MSTATVDVENGAATDTAAAPAQDATLSPARQRLEDQIGWYDAKSRHNQRWFKLLKICQIVTAAAIPVAAAGSGVPKWPIGAAGALIVVLEGIQQLQQYQQNWVSYRSTCERLRHEKFLYASNAGPYAGASPDARLAERVEGLVSQEHAAWAAHREDAMRQPSGQQ